MLNLNTEKLNKIGNTPIKELVNTKRYFSLASNIYAKLEWNNPFGSIKDRIAFNIIKEAINEGKINENSIVVEATSGNTGIGLAGVCKELGLKCIIFMPESMSIERRKLIQDLGGEIILTPKVEGMSGAVNRANEFLKENPNAFLADQFNNENNFKAHKKTALEVYEQLNGKIDIFVAGIGTGGTIMGFAKYLKELIPNLKIIGVEPKSSPFISENKKGSHLIQGIGAGFIPGILDTNLLDEVITIEDDVIYPGVSLVKSIEKLGIGLSSVCNYHAAVRVAKKYPNTNIVTVFPDDDSKYQSVL